MSEDEDLRKRIQRLETVVTRQQELLQKLAPSRRAVLKGGTTAAAGAAVGSLLTGGAAAGTDEAGQIGSPSRPQDVWVEDLYDKNDNAVVELPGDGSLSIDQETVTDNGFRIILSSDQSIPDNTFTQLAFDSVVDDNNTDTLTLSNNEVTVNEGGYYLINLKVEYPNISSGTSVTTVISVDGTFGVNDETSHVSNGEPHFYSGPLTRKLNAGETIQFQTRQQSGGSLSVNSLERRTYANVVRLG